MAESWSDLSEINAGLLLQRRIDPRVVRPSLFISPFDKLCEIIQNTPDWETDLLIEKVGINTVQTALDAVTHLNGLGEKADWVKLLEKTYTAHTVGVALEKYGKQLQRGVEVDWTKVTEMGNRLVNQKSGMIPLSEVEAGEIPFIKTGWKPIDVHLGGLPKSGLITVGGIPGTGKTSWLIKLASKYVRRHKTKKVAIYTLEMVLAEFANRVLEIEPGLDPETKSRIVVSDEVLKVDELCNRAAMVDNLGMIGIDFADLLIPGLVGEQEMSSLYKSLAALAKRLAVPVVLLSQLSRGYSGGLPRPYSLRYSGLAEALSWMVMMLYAPSRDYFAEEKEKEHLLPVVPGKAYILCWKCRGGFRIHGSPGAIQLNWKGETSWSDQPGSWFTLEKNSGRAEEDDDEDD